MQLREEKGIKTIVMVYKMKILLLSRGNWEKEKNWYIVNSIRLIMKCTGRIILASIRIIGPIYRKEVQTFM